MTTTPTAYRPAQIWLHWIVVIGVILQIGFNSAIVAVVDAREAGQAPAASDMTWAWFHVGIGSAILLAVIARLVLRSAMACPAMPSAPRPRRLGSRASCTKRSTACCLPWS